MLKTILKRLVQLVPILFVVITLTFVLTRLIPGNPAAILMGPQASPDEIARMREELGLNKPMLEQFFDYLIGVLRGDFGRSVSYNRPVLNLILDRLPATLQITLSSMVLAVLIGVPIGIFSAVKQYSALDYIFMVLALVGVSMPIFWLGLMLVLVFSVKLGWFAVLGMGSLQNGFWDVIQHMVLPVVCLTTIPTATFARITRSSMLEVVNKESVKALRARGIREAAVIWRHALKNALPPLVTVVGMQLAGAFSGAILTETIFSWPGMGMLIYSAVFNRDYALIQGAVLFIAIVFVFVNLIVDLIYLMINPRVSYEGGEEIA
ncbi:MAG: ABC transporter permease [Peptococcaceae bacterium]|nr:ABC transporter permease [Peptococcaceae bacterium]